MCQSAPMGGPVAYSRAHGLPASVCPVQQPPRNAILFGCVHADAEAQAQHSHLSEQAD